MYVMKNKTAWQNLLVYFVLSVVGYKKVLTDVHTEVKFKIKKVVTAVLRDHISSNSFVSNWNLI